MGGSSDLEVQERASSSLHLLTYVQKQRDKGESTEGLQAELATFFQGELNPVAPKAQKKVPVPEGLDLDAWINEPEEEEGSEEIQEPTEEELTVARSNRLQSQSGNPNYLKDTPKPSPSRERGDSIADILVQAIDLDIPLHIPGLASTDSYYNLSESGSHGKKPKKKKKKSSKKTEIPSSDDEEVGPNMFVSRNIDLPEGASISDLDRSDTDDGDDPYKALG